MVICAVIGCSHRTGRDKCGFFTIPAVITSQCDKTHDLSRRRRQLWLSRIHRQDIKVSRDTRVCGRHFTQGHPAKLFEDNHPDWAPSLFLNVGCITILETPSDVQEKAEKALDRYQRLQKRRKQRLESATPARKRLKMSSESRDVTASDESFLAGAHTSLDDSVTSMSFASVAQSSPFPGDTVGVTTGVATVTDRPEVIEPVCDSQEESSGNQGEISVCDSGVTICEEDRGPFSAGSEPAYHKNANVSVQTDVLGATIEVTRAEIERLRTEMEALKSQNSDLTAKCEVLDKDNIAMRCELLKLRDEIKNMSIDQAGFENNDVKVKFYTGLPTYSLLMHIFKFVENKISYSLRNALPKFSEFVLVLMRLRLGLLEQDLAYRFKVSQTTVSFICEKWIPVMSMRLSKLIVWPDRDVLQKTMPICFREAFGTKVAVIIDCFEVFTDRPTSLVTRAETWSQYKHHNTVKFLIGITPQGTVCFISRGWGGRASDQCIVLNSGFLDKLAPGDVVLADRGFTIEDDVALRQAKLEIPAFTKGRTQLPCEDANQTRTIANVRIHVERIIGFMRRKFRILHSILPVSFLVQRSEGGDAQIDHIVRACCALSNLCPPIVERDDGDPPTTA